MSAARKRAAKDTEVPPVGSVLVVYSGGLVERGRVDIEVQIAALLAGRSCRGRAFLVRPPGR